MYFYLLYGEDKALVNKKLNEQLDDLKIRKENIIKYNLEEVNFDDIIKEACMVSLFSGSKAIIVDITTALDNKNLDFSVFEKYLDNYNEKSYLFFVSYTPRVDTRKKIVKLLQSKGKVLELKKDDKYLYNYVLDSLNKDNYKMEDINYFLNKTGSNIDNITSELDKLKLNSLSSKLIKNEDIDFLIEANFEEEIFALGNAVINNDKNKSLALYHDFINKGYEPVYIISLLGNQFRFLFQVKRLLNKNKTLEEIASILEANFYRVKYASRDCYNYYEEDLLHYLKKLADLDKNIKLGHIDKNLGLELFLINKNL